MSDLGDYLAEQNTPGPTTRLLTGVVTDASVSPPLIATDGGTGVPTPCVASYRAINGDFVTVLTDWDGQFGASRICLGAVDPPRLVRTVTVNTFTSVGNGTWTKPANLLFAFVHAVGGGGGGGGAGVTGAGESSIGGGGSSGGESWRWLTASQLDATEAVVVGEGGNGGTGSNNGSNGDDSSFGGDLVVARGGIGGQGDAGSTNPHISTGGARPGAGTGTYAHAGYPGGNGIFVGGTERASGIGGGPGGQTRPGANDGEDGGQWGGGGSGGANSPNQGVARTGGKGGQGFVMVVNFIG